MNMRCDRCHNETDITTMSYLNTDTLCMECKEEEKHHPRYKEAKEAELKAVQSGNMNYPGLLR